MITAQYFNLLISYANETENTEVDIFPIHYLETT